MWNPVWRRGRRLQKYNSGIWKVQNRHSCPSDSTEFPTPWFVQIPVSVHQTCNKFTSTFVQEITALYNEHPAPIIGSLIGHSSDGDFHRCHLMVAISFTQDGDRYQPPIPFEDGFSAPFLKPSMTMDDSPLKVFLTNTIYYTCAQVANQPLLPCCSHINDGALHGTQ